MRYVFEKAGDGLPKHSHEADTAHNVVVLFGSVSVNVEGEASKIVSQGHVCDFDWSKPHYIVALEPGTLILNLLLSGMPEAYKDPDVELTGVYDVNG